MSDLKAKALIFVSIFTLSNKLQILGDRMDRKLSTKQWLLLAGVINSGSAEPSIGEVAGLINSSRQNVKKMALILEKAGFVSMRKDPQDARILRLRPTEACMEHLRGREVRENRFLEALFGGFEAEELRAFARLIEKLKDNVREMEISYDDRHEEEA
ncbi:MAG: MarR family transcriptional regulator [Christensenellaceae bacterium]|nr:MarR family transcriptional regulator [Christensenellaceae bacterium]